MRKLIVSVTFVLITLHSLVLAQSAPEFPAGWEPATKTDYSDAALSFVKNQVPNHITADLDGNDKADEAWILINTSKNVFGLFVFLAQKDGTYTMISLDEQKRETEKLFMGISLMEPGQYQTRCGKRYWHCKDFEPYELKLKLPGINYFAFEGANSVFFWRQRPNKFFQMWMSD